MYDFDKYKTKLPYAPRSKDPAMCEAYMKDQARLEAMFRTDALEAVGLTTHPKADKAFAYAWEHGHASGYSEVFIHLQDIAELLRD